MFKQFQRTSSKVRCVPSLPTFLQYWTQSSWGWGSWAHETRNMWQSAEHHRHSVVDRMQAGKLPGLPTEFNTQQGSSVFFLLEVVARLQYSAFWFGLNYIPRSSPASRSMKTNQDRFENHILNASTPFSEHNAVNMPVLYSSFQVIAFHLMVTWKTVGPWRTKLLQP